jgi:hypothetical protein
MRDTTCSWFQPPGSPRCSQSVSFASAALAVLCQAWSEAAQGRGLDASRYCIHGGQISLAVAGLPVPPFLCPSLISPE